MIYYVCFLYNNSGLLYLPFSDAPGNTAIARQPSPAVLQKPASIFNPALFRFAQRLLFSALLLSFPGGLELYYRSYPRVRFDFRSI